MKRILLAIAALTLAPVAYAGVQSAHQAENAKWMRVSGNWTVDTEDIEVRGDQIRFWVRRNPTGNEEMSTHTKPPGLARFVFVAATSTPNFSHVARSITTAHLLATITGGHWEKIDQS